MGSAPAEIVIVAFDLAVGERDGHADEAAETVFGRPAIGVVKAQAVDVDDEVAMRIAEAPRQEPHEIEDEIEAAQERFIHKLASKSRAQAGRVEQWWQFEGGKSERGQQRRKRGLLQIVAEDHGAALQKIGIALDGLTQHRQKLTARIAPNEDMHARHMRAKPRHSQVGTYESVNRTPPNARGYFR